MDIHERKKTILNASKNEYNFLEFFFFLLYFFPILHRSLSGDE